MTKITVEQLAKTLKVKSEDVLKCMESLGTFVPNAKAYMTMEEVRKVCIKLTGKAPRIKKAGEDSSAAQNATAAAQNAAAGAAKSVAADKATADKTSADKTTAKTVAEKSAATQKATAVAQSATAVAQSATAATQKVAAEKPAVEQSVTAVAQNATAGTAKSTTAVAQSATAVAQSATAEKSAVEQKAAAAEKPAVAQKATAAAQSATAEKSAVEQKATVAAQSATAEKPAVAQKATAAATQSATAEKPAVDQKAAAATQSATAEKPAVEQKATATAQNATAAAQSGTAEKKNAPQKNAAQKPSSDKPREERRPSGDRPNGERTYNNRPNGDRPNGERTYNNRPNGDRPNGERTYNNRPNGDRPNGERTYNNRPNGDRSNGERTYNNRPNGDRTNGDRPYNNRPNGDRPGGDRPYGNRQGGDRPYGNRQGTDRPSYDKGGFDKGGFDKDKDAVKPFNNQSRGGAARKSHSDLELPEVKRDTISADKQKNDRVHREKDKEKERNKNNNVGENFSKHRNLMQFDAEDENGMVRTHVKKAKPVVAKPAVVEEEIKVVALPPTLTVREFADLVKKPVTQIIKSLMLKGKMMGQNDDLEYEDAEALALDMDILAEPMQEEDIFKAYTDIQDDPASLVTRPPVVVVMGHVDHGKTSLLDAIRNTKVTAGEAGGITQHIGASIVSVPDPDEEGKLRKITFLDTPGHEAFTAMRLRGAQATDIAILVVAADDGIMPQTIEAINHAKAAGVELIVAINKMDKPTANPDHVKQQLTEHGVFPEGWGGDTICVPVSAKTGMGIDTLLEMVLFTADDKDYKANPNRPATGQVIEAQLDKGRGVVATCLVQNGTLNVGDSIVVGKAFGKIKAMNDDKGKRVKTAGPSMAVEILGLSEVPVAGEPFFVTPGEHEARQLAEKVMARDRRKLIEGTKKVSLDDLFNQIEAGDMKELNIIVKADVQGSVEAVRQSLEKLSNDKVALKIIHGAVGAINESDVTLASTANAIIIGFNVRPDNSAKTVAEHEKVDIRLYRVIYDAIEDVEAAMKGMLDPEFREKVYGSAEVRQVFHGSGIGTVAGSYVVSGKLVRGANARLIRDSVVVYDGTIDSMRRFKDDVHEVTVNYECGVVLKDYSDIKEGDIIEAYTMEEIKQE